MNVTRVVSGFLIVVVSGAACAFLDMAIGIKEPSLYWAIGGCTGIVAKALMK